MTFLAILGFVATISFLAFRNTFFGLKLLGGMSWILFFLYIKDNPPGTIVEGSAVHTVLLVISIGFGLMIVLSGLGRGISRTEKWNEKQSETSEGFHFKLPDWLNASNDSPEAREQKTNESLEEYRGTIRQALRTGKYGKRR